MAEAPAPETAEAFAARLNLPADLLGLDWIDGPVVTQYPTYMWRTSRGHYVGPQAESSADVRVRTRVDRTIVGTVLGAHPELGEHRRRLPDLASVTEVRRHERGPWEGEQQ